MLKQNCSQNTGCNISINEGILMGLPLSNVIVDIFIKQSDQQNASNMLQKYILMYSWYQSYFLRALFHQKIIKFH
jgi:hypothetical protein